MDEFTTIADFLVGDRRAAGLLLGPDAFLAELGCMIAIAPTSSQIGQLLSRALAGDISYEFIEAALIHAIGYVGILPAQTVHEALQKIAQGTGQGPHHAFAKIPRMREERVELGLALYGRFDPDRAAAQGKKFAAVSPLYYPRALEISGLTLRSNALPLRQRQIMTVAMLASLGIEPQLRFHIGVALEKEVTKDQLAGVLLFVQVYAGMPRANAAALIAKDAFGLGPTPDKI